MQKDALNNVHISDEHILITPDQLKAEFPLSVEQEAQIAHSRQTISDIIAGLWPRRSAIASTWSCASILKNPAPPSAGKG